MDASGDVVIEHGDSVEEEKLIPYVWIRLNLTISVVVIFVWFGLSWKPFLLYHVFLIKIKYDSQSFGMII